MAGDRHTGVAAVVDLTFETIVLGKVAMILASMGIRIGSAYRTPRRANRRMALQSL